MLTYVGFILIIIGLLIWMKKSESKKPAIILIIFLILFSGLRYRVGTDYALYEEIYLGIHEGSNLNRTGVGYRILSNIFSFVFPNTVVPLIFCVSVVTNLCVYRFCKKNSINPIMSLFFYIVLGFYTVSFNIFRQMLSVSLVLLGYNFLKGNKYVRYAVLSLLAILIHKVAILGIVVIFIFEKIWKKKLNPIFLVAFGIMGLLCYDYLYELILTTLAKFLSVYINNQGAFIPRIGTFALLIVYGFLFVITYLKRNELIKKNNNNLTYINIFSCAYILMLFSVKNILFMRLSYYINVFIILILPELYNVYIENFKYKKIANVILAIGCIIYFLLYVYCFDGVLPYNTIISEFIK